MSRSIAAKTLLSTASLLALVVAAPALAQEAAPAAREETTVIVTGARQRAENAQDVPISVASFSAKTIAEAGIARPQDFISLTPNVSFIQTTNVGETAVNIRGVIQPRDTEPPFAFVTDGVLIPNPNAFNQELVDIASIEIIKGPIGSIYGRNAVGGAILVNTQKPSSTFEGVAQAGYEFEGKEFKVGGYVSGPLSDKVFARLTVNHSDREGYFDNITRKAKEDPFTETVIRGRMVIEVADNVELDLQAGYGKVDGYAFNFHNQFSFTPGFAGGIDTGNTSIPYVGNIKSFNEQDRWNASAKLAIETEAGTLSGFVAYNELSETAGGEGAADLALFGLLGPARPGVPAATEFFANPALYEGYGPTDRDGSQFQERSQKDSSFEVRFTSKGTEAFRYIVGAYYIDFERDIILLSGGAAPGATGVIRTAPVFTPAQALTGANGVSGTGGANNNTAWAVFGQAAYDITPTLELSGALRYDKEDRENTNLVFGALGTTVIAPVGAKRQTSFSATQPRVSLRWEATPDLTFYGTYGEGFRSGGFNPLGSRARIIGIDGLTGTTVRDQFPSEKSKSFEIGAKSTLFDGKVSLNGAAFSTKVTNAHFFQFFPFSLARVISIVDENQITGAEFDFNAKITDHLTFFGGAGVLNSEIKRNREAPGTVGKTFPNTPEHSIVLGAQYTREVSAGLDFSARLEWNQTGKVWFDTTNAPGSARPVLDLVNARLSLDSAAWTATLYARNLFDEQYNIDAVVLPIPALGTTFNFVTPGTPRTVGIEFKYRFGG